MDYLTMTLIGVCFLVFGIFSYLIWEIFFHYKHRFVLKLPSNNGSINIVTRAAEINDKGTPKWKLQYKKMKIPVPPKEALDINKNGKYFVEAWMGSDGQIKFVSHKNADDVQVLTTNQRIMLAAEYARAESQRKKTIMDFIMQFGLPISMFLILAGVVVMGMIMWGDLAEPSLEKAQLEKLTIEMYQENLEILKEIKYDIQILPGVEQFKEKIQNVPD